MKYFSVVLLMNILFLSGCIAQKATTETEVASETETVDVSIASEGIDPYAQEILEASCNLLSKADKMYCRAIVWIDEINSSNMKLQSEKQVDLYLDRPGKVYAETTVHEEKRKIWYDGEYLTMMHEQLGIYGQAATPDSIDEMLDFIMDKYGIVAPMADFLYSDPFSILTEQVDHGIYAGRSTVNGKACHHLAFSQEMIDWQIWIRDDALPLPVKFIIIYKNEETHPQYTAIFTDWDFEPHVYDDMFSPLDSELNKLEKIEILEQQN